jgi:predicted amidohydrolase
MKLAIGQINTNLGDLKTNLEKHLIYIENAIKAHADLIVFPELSLTGYALQDLATSVAHRFDSSDTFYQPLLKISKSIDIVVGFVDEDSRHRFFIASAYLSGGNLIHVHHKVYLPTYGLFDEGRFFAWGNSVKAFNTRFGRMGIAICEDFWHASPPYILWIDGADLFIFTSASPGRGLTQENKLESARWVEQINRAYANLFTSYVVHVNRVGYEDGLNFWGGSTVFDPNGGLLIQGPYYEEAMIITDIDLDQLHRTRARLPLLRDERTSLMQREIDRVVKGIQGNLR